MRRTLLICSLVAAAAAAPTLASARSACDQRAHDRKVTGTVVPVPLDFGGDVDGTSRPEAAISWRFTADPVLGVVGP